eukprot:4752494-Pleurochrysis_carterae.AAC.1
MRRACPKRFPGRECASATRTSMRSDHCLYGLATCQHKSKRHLARDARARARTRARDRWLGWRAPEVAGC